MAVPATTPISAPAGIRLGDGYSTRIKFAADTDVSFWEKTIPPPGLDGGEAIDNTTMVNTAWRTFAPRALVTLTEFSFSAAYDPNAYNNILDNLLNVEGAITVHFPDLSTIDFYGFLRMFEPQDHEEGTQPEANVTIRPTNYDPVNNVEAAPVLTSVAGT